MQIYRINGFVAHCKSKGIEHEVSLFLLKDEVLPVSDFIVVDKGNAIQKISRKDVRTAWELYDQMLAGSLSCTTGSSIGGLQCCQGKQKTNQGSKSNE